MQKEDCLQLAYFVKFVAFQIVLMHGLFTDNAKWMLDWSLLHFSMTVYVSERLFYLSERPLDANKNIFHQNESIRLNTNVWLGSGNIPRSIWTGP